LASIKGSVQGSSQRLRVQADLISTKDGSYLWSNTYDTSLGDVFTLEDQISFAVANALALEVSSADPDRRRTIDPKAYELYLRGQSHMNARTGPGMRMAVTYFEQALQVDPQFAEAYSGLASVYSQLGEYGIDPLQESIQKGKANAMRALELDNTLSQAHASLGLIKSVYEWNWTETAREFNLAVEEDPNDANARLWYGTMLYMQGKSQASIQELNRGLASDPLSIPINATLGWAYYNGRKPDVALQYAAKALDLDPQAVPALALVVYAQMLRHDFPKALEACRQVEKVLGPGPRSTWYFGLVYAVSGDRGKAAESIRQLHSMTQDRGFRPIYLATIYTSVGDNDSAIHWLNEALADHDPYLPMLYADPLTDPLRADPRFEEILRRINM
jgi:tetratricopeptide (TPR) repeat protein